MDRNKYEALLCLQIVKSAIESGDRYLAHKFLNKALRLDPSIQIDHLLIKIQEFPNESTHKIPTTVPGPRKRVAYAVDQKLIVTEINMKKDYYDILGIHKSCMVEDVRKAYRNLSLKVHPDKNHSPGADDAFMKVSKAFRCLSDEESRRMYDVSGSDEPLAERRGMQGFNGFYADDVDDAEVMFMHTAASAQFRGFRFAPGMGVRTGGDRGSRGFSVKLILLMPVVIILLLNFMPSSQSI